MMARRGNCYVASEALYHIMGGNKAGWKPMRFPMSGPDKRMDTHWFLMHKSGVIVDPSRRQFKHKLDYTIARGSGFLTKKPSKRAKKLMRELTWQV